MRHAPLSSALVVTAALALAGCAGTPEFPLVEPTAVMGEDAAAGGRWFAVPVTAGDAPVTIEGAAFLSPYFTAAAGVEVGVDLAPGESVDLSVPVGAVTCPAGRGSTTLQLVLAADGREVVQSVEVRGRALEERNAVECGQAAITGAITPGFGTIDAAEPLAVRTTALLVRVSGTESVTLAAVSGSEQFAVTADDGALPATLRATGQRLEVPVTIEAVRCDGLPFGGAASAFAFSFELGRPGEDPVRVPVRPEGDLLAALEAIATSCDEAPAG